MDKKVQGILNRIVDTGYKNYDNALKEYNELLEKSKVVQPDVSEEARQAYILNMMLGKAPHPLTIKAYVLGVGGAFDQNKRLREKALKEGYVNEKGEPIYVNLPESRKKYEGTPIPSPEDSTTRVCYFIGTTVVEGQEENWKRIVLWNRVKGLVPPVRNLVEFKVDGMFNKAVPSLNTMDGTQFKVISEDKINFAEMANTMLSENICNLEDISVFEQPKDCPLTIFRAQVVRATVTKDPKVNNPVELRMIAETLDDVLKADNVENVTAWCDEAVPLDFGEGDIVWCITNKFVKQDGSYSLSGLGFYVEKSAYPQNKPAPITEENSKAVEKEVAKPENWGEGEKLGETESGVLTGASHVPEKKQEGGEGNGNKSTTTTVSPVEPASKTIQTTLSTSTTTVAPTTE